jgi:hypothetical protein
LSGLSTGLLAQTNAPDPRPSRMDKMHERMAERHRQHLTELKAKLQLQASQEAAWDVFAQSMKAPAKPLAHPDHGTLEKLTTPERIDRIQTFMRERDAQMRQHGDATKMFYASLNAEQQKVFDAETARFMNAYMRQGSPQGMYPGYGIKH